MNHYENTQTGTVLLEIFGLVLVSFGILWPSELRGYSLFVPLTLIIIAALFSTLTAKVGGDFLTWYFGPHFWKNRISTSDIRSAVVVKTPCFSGWGIRFTPQGWLFNVSGTTAVNVDLKSGSKYHV
jgi:hypothetical protein